MCARDEDEDESDQRRPEGPEGAAEYLISNGQSLWEQERSGEGTALRSGVAAVGRRARVWIQSRLKSVGAGGIPGPTPYCNPYLLQEAPRLLAAVVSKEKMINKALMDRTSPKPAALDYRSQQVTPDEELCIGKEAIG
ncbi:hypothetical protein EYF80_052599 [Liparis tanakae]|uniref:Uncharacterized protein n=1 Tax=Liparis tanakae TaxID=230148 RepID=A0A4Z2F8P0_9TELE|nr:hypothetical protein EYF80_052599 [Liparis tanakae]